MSENIFGREAAIFVPTGTMGNQIAIKIHTQPGQEIVCEERAHIFNWEMASLAAFSGCMVRPVRSASGDGINRFAKCAQRTLIRELNRDDNGDADSDAGDGERGPRLLAEDRTDDEGEEN